MTKDKSWRRYFQAVAEILAKIQATQAENIEAAAAVLTDCVANNGLIHVFGVGHSSLLAEEVNWRAATLAPIHAILEPSMTGQFEVTKSGYMEKLEGSGEIIVGYHRIAPPDAVIIASNSGNNGAPIEVAAACRKRGVKVIAITAVTYSDYLTPLHSSGKKLKDEADVVVDNCCPIGDGALNLEGLEQTVGPTSTAAGIPILNAILAQTVENLLEKGTTPDVYFNGSLSANSQAVAEHNQRLVDKYFYKIRNL
jgi:uncharacterized phosphosugar-binding protein